MGSPATMHGGLGLRRVVSLLLAVAVLSCGRDPGAGGPAAQKARPVPPSIALLVVDTLRRDHLGAYGYSSPRSTGAGRYLSGLKLVSG